jgi:hypothetical protein
MHAPFVSIAAAAFAFCLACSSEQSVLGKSQPGNGPDASGTGGARATRDARAPLPDARVPLPDARVPLPDARAPLPDGSAPLPDAPFVQPESPPPVCRGAFHSTIPGASIVFRTERCVYTLAEARAGIRIDYDLVLEHDVPGFVPPKFGYAYQSDTVAGLDVGEVLSGGGQRYCLCDEGLPYRGCPLDDGGFSHPELNGLTGGCSAVTLSKGTYSRTFTWDGVNWSGPSDTGNPKGAPFPPGDYTLTVSTTPGTLDVRDAGATDAGSTMAAINATFPVRLVR